MPLRRTADYLGIITWILSMVFFGGMFYNSQQNQDKLLVKHQAIVDRIPEMDTEIQLLKMQQGNQIKFQKDIMETMKSMLSEIKSNNDRGIIIETKLENIEGKLK